MAPETNATTQQLTPAPNAAGGGQQPGQAGEQDKRFTQEELNRIIEERLTRERAKYADYEQVKARLQTIEDAAKTELQKAQEAAQKAQAERDKALYESQDRMLRAAFLAEAALLGVQHPGDAYNLADLTAAHIAEDGTVKGVAEQVKALVEAGRLPLSGKPRSPQMGAGAGSGQGPTEPTGTLTEEERVIAKKLGLTDDQYLKSRAGAPKPRQ